jgi:hypothetical protein
METVTAIWTFLTVSVGPYWPYIWPFLFTCVVSMVMGQLFRRRVWTSENARKNALFAFGRATIPAHPILIGLVQGLLWRNPCGESWTLIASVAYIVGSGLVGLIGYLFLDTWVEKKFGVDLDVLFDDPVSIPPTAAVHGETLTDVDLPKDDAA